MARFPILMYHNVTADSEKSVGLTISKQKLEEQFQYIVSKGYQSLHFSDLEEGVTRKGKIVVLTFDDVTRNQLEYAVPLLKKYNLKATFFIPFAYVGKTDEWNAGSEELMTLAELQGLDEIIELGYHSFYHRPYAKLATAEITDDFSKCQDYIEKNNLKVYPVLAYPYGNYFKKEPYKTKFFQQLQDEGMQYAVRIGNKLNAKTALNRYELKRIDVKGEATLLQFRMKLRFGKLF